MIVNGAQFTNITVLGDSKDDGSIQAAGILFVNTIREYDIIDPGVNVEDCYFRCSYYNIH
jgi:hypothetical protein